MIEYFYQAVDSNGKTKKGTLQAKDDKEFFQQLQDMQLYCTNYRSKDSSQVKVKDVKYRFSLKDTSIFCREFSIMLSSGINIISALNLLYDRCDKAKQKQSYLKLVEQVQKGDTLNEAMRALGKTFPTLLISMAMAGESSGSLDLVISKMAVYYEKENRMKSRIQTAMVYPILLVIVTIAVIIGLFTFVLPNFFTLFEGQNLPFLTRFYMAVSKFMTGRWYVLVIFAGIASVAMFILHKNPAIMLKVDQAKLKVPIFGRLFEKIIIARFCNTMNILYSSGIAILKAIEICSDTIENRYVKEKLTLIVEEVGKGASLSSAMEKERIFDRIVWSMVHIGEESGNLDQMFLKLSDYYEDESDQATQKMMALVEPLMLIIIALIVGTVVASILMPIYGMYETIQ